MLLVVTAKNGKRMRKIEISKLNIALFIALLFNISGFIGIIFTSHKDWFISATPITLFVMASLLIFTHEERNFAFLIFLFTAFLTGMVVEIVGVNTGALFGEYNYNNLLGAGFKGVPFIIGINWFVVIYCCGSVTFVFEEWLTKKMLGDGIQFSGRMQLISFAIDAALLTVFFDWMMEPAAVKLGFWQWKSNSVPLFNYLCWFFISAGLMIVFRKLNFNKHNIFALHLLLIQMLFFLSIETFL
jgi:bisanhydrobacterioruberin hydratase